MKILFEASQPFQLDAIAAVVDVFRGETAAAHSGWSGGRLSVANRCHLTDTELLQNVREVQARNALLQSEQLNGRNFSVEMETGTGKTYVYLRTAFELCRLYGFAKFVVVVPSVAIRQGVTKSIDLLRDHFKSLYPGMPLFAWAYDSIRVSRLKEFAMGSGLHVLVLNIDSFNKDSAILNKPHDRFQGRRPMDYVAACLPVVVVDEPQELESEGSRGSIALLNPLCTLRYSATHRYPYNLLYRLDPVQAYELGLVKRIEVNSVLDDDALAIPYVQVREIRTNSAGKPVATVRIDANAPAGVERRTISVKVGSDLFELSGKRQRYEHQVVARIDLRKRAVHFANGSQVREGASSGGRTDDVMRLQVRETVRAQFEKEVEFNTLPASRRMKVLSLFFVDRVANYAASDGKIRKWFEEAYRSLSKAAKYKTLGLPPCDAAQAAYFATVKGAGIDSATGRPTLADQEAFRLIMRDKERLLSLEEPVRFIFTHSALREGWDNPNVFQICTLNEAFSEIRKRQEIGRGLRLPVQVDGTRCLDRRRNRLTVITNEYYEDFAAALQNEIADECGVEFGSRLSDARKRVECEPSQRVLASSAFRTLWRAVRQQTRYDVTFEDRTLVDAACARLRALPETKRPAVVTIRSDLAVGKDGVTGTTRSRSRTSDPAPELSIPDVLGTLRMTTGLTRECLTQILVRSGRLADFAVNPHAFLDRASTEIKEALRETLVRGVRYMPVPGQRFTVDSFEALEAYQDRLVPVAKSIYPFVEVDSNVERSFAQGLEGREDVELFVKLPRWFKIETPVGGYNPDWVVLLRDQGGKRAVVVCETKGSSDPERLRWQSERDKITCGRAHFTALGVPFAQVSSVVEVQS